MESPQDQQSERLHPYNPLPISVTTTPLKAIPALATAAPQPTMESPANKITDTPKAAGKFTRAELSSSNPNLRVRDR
jgi:hypothetical protein